jgi:hypothetical protein
VDEFDERTLANMDVVLDEICRELPNGGDHESRKFIAGPDKGKVVSFKY